MLATSDAGAVVKFTVTATDNVGVTSGPTCKDEFGSTVTSGSTFPIGVTTVTCTAIDAAGNEGSSTFTVTVQDTLHLVSPLNAKFTLVNSPTFVWMAVTDLSAPVTYEIQVDNNPDFSSPEISESGLAETTLGPVAPLTPGVYSWRVRATDGIGNVRPFSAVRTFMVATNPTITLDAGNNQTGRIGEDLQGPLVVVLDDAGIKFQGVHVLFRVTENNGTLSNSPEEVRSIAVLTDDQGRASVNWTLGTRAGDNIVEAVVVGVAGKVTFTATGTGLIDDPSQQKINVDAGFNQTGAVNQPLPKPFAVVVTDIGHNRLKGIEVTFTVVEGGGNFQSDANFNAATPGVLKFTTLSDGVALAILTLGPGQGFDNNVVDADFSGNPGAAAMFTASGLVAGDPAETRVSGVVLDNTDVPIPGVIMRLLVDHVEVLSTVTDEQGQFTLGSPAQPAPVGDIVLFADASQVNRPGDPPGLAWPDMEFEMVTVAAGDNTIGMPIYLLPLDIPNGLTITVDPDTGQQTGGTLTLPEVPGFSLSVLDNSVTFPDGSKSGVVSVTLVHADKIPMVPNFGQQPRFIVTIQPAGVLFNPPAPITIPNVDGLAPGEITELYSFDHDLGRFVSIGTGAVSEDGSIIESDPGVGIIKGGWHCGGNPAEASSAESVSVEITEPDAEARESAIELALGDTLVIVAEGGPTPGKYSWVSSDPDIVEITFPSPPQGDDPTDEDDVTDVKVVAKKGGSVNITVTFTCDTGASESDSILIEVIDGNISFTLHDPRVWPEHQDNDYVYETNPPDVTAAMISGQNKTATGINPATVNDDNFKFKMKQPGDALFSHHNDDSSKYEVNPFNDLNGKKAVRIYPLIDEKRVAQKVGTYVFKFWNKDDDDDPFTTSCFPAGFCNPPSTDSGVRDFAGNMLDFIPNTQKPEPFVEITVIYESRGEFEFIKIKEVPEVTAISVFDYERDF